MVQLLHLAHASTQTPAGRTQGVSASANEGLCRDGMPRVACA